MQIIPINKADDIHQSQPVVLVLGYFDGLHLGHKALFDKAKAIAEQEDLEIAVLTFYESPKLIFTRFSSDLLLHLAYPEKRYARFESCGVNKLYLADFTSSFAQISSDDFIKNYIERLKAKHIVVGFDYQFGHDRTDSNYLSNHFSGQVHTIAEVKKDGQKISSTHIRKLVAEGHVKEANRLLGDVFSTRGIVVHGDARGRTIGFPTANLAPIDRTFLPADGVYVTEVAVDGKFYRSMTSVGKNVTFGGTELRLEVHIFEFDKDIYGQKIEIFWLDKIRDMIKFDSVDKLVGQLKSDQLAAENFKKS